MKKGVIVVLVIAVAVIAYMALKSDKPMGTDQPMVSGSASPRPTGTSMGEKTVNVTLGAQNSSGESGTATLKEKDGKVVVSIRVNGEPTGANQPAHIHTGTCPNPGPVLHGLTNVVDGKSETTVNATMAQLMNAGPLAINLHKSAAQSSVYVACGNIVF